MAERIEARLKELGILLPALPQPGGNYLPARTVGQIVYLAGVISIHDGAVITGTAGAGQTIEEGYAAARACALIQLAVLTAHLGSLDKVKNIVTVNGYVTSIAIALGWVIAFCQFSSQSACCPVKPLPVWMRPVI